MEQRDTATVQEACVKNRCKEKFAKDRNNTVLVELLLLCGHVYTEDLFHLGRKRFFHIFLDTSQKERLKDLVKTLITIIPSFPVYILKILPGIKPAVHNGYKRHSCLGALAQYHIKHRNRDILVRHEEVQQWPELFEGVLQRSASNEESVIGPELH